MDLGAIVAQYWEVFVVSFGLGVFLTIMAVKFFPRIGLLDRPHLYGLKRAPIPYYGGVAIYLGFVMLVSLFVDFTPEVFEYESVVAWGFGGAGDGGDFGFDCVGVGFCFFVV